MLARDQQLTWATKDSGLTIHSAILRILWLHLSLDSHPVYTCIEGRHTGWGLMVATAFSAFSRRAKVFSEAPTVLLLCLVGQN